MGRRNFNTFIKKQKEDKKRKKKKEKQQKKEERKIQATGSKPDDMIAYVDKLGNITSEPPGENDKNRPKEEKDTDTSEESDAK